MTHATAKKIKEQNEEHHDEQLPTNTNLKKGSPSEIVKLSERENGSNTTQSEQDCAI